MVLHESQKTFDFRKIGGLNLQLADYARSNKIVQAPRAVEHLKAMSMWKKMNLMDQDAFRETVSLFGDSKNIRLVGSCPLSVWALTLDLYPEIFQDQKEFRKWLKANRYDAPQGHSKSTHLIPRTKVPASTIESRSLVSL
jgi:hypothetical protein